MIASLGNGPSSKMWCNRPPRDSDKAVIETLPALPSHIRLNRRRIPVDGIEIMPGNGMMMGYTSCMYVTLEVCGGRKECSGSFRMSLNGGLAALGSQTKRWRSQVMALLWTCRSRGSRHWHRTMYTSPNMFRDWHDYLRTSPGRNSRDWIQSSGKDACLWKETNLSSLNPSPQDEMPPRLSNAFPSILHRLMSHIPPKAMFGYIFCQKYSPNRCSLQFYPTQL